MLEKSGLLGVRRVAHESLNSQQFSLSHLSASFNAAMCNFLITTVLNLPVNLTLWRQDRMSLHVSQMYSIQGGLQHLENQIK